MERALSGGHLPSGCYCVQSSRGTVCQPSLSGSKWQNVSRVAQRDKTAMQEPLSLANTCLAAGPAPGTQAPCGSTSELGGKAGGRPWARLAQVGRHRRQAGAGSVQLRTRCTRGGGLGAVPCWLQAHPAPGTAGLLPTQAPSHLSCQALLHQGCPCTGAQWAGHMQRATRPRQVRPQALRGSSVPAPQGLCTHMWVSRLANLTAGGKGSARGGVDP